MIKITLSGGSKFDPYALYFDAAEKLTVVDFAQWQAGQAALEVQKDPDGAEVLFGTMPAYSFSKAGFAAGIEPTVSAGGSVLTLGREGRYSKTVTIAVANDLPMEIEEVAVAKTGESLVLVNSTRVETGRFLVRVDTVGLRGMGRTGAAVYRGQPILLAQGYEVHSRMREEVHHQDEIWVLGEGDVLRVGQLREEMAADVVIYVVGGAICHEPFRPWQLRDARANPAPYVAEGWCPMDRLPPEWVGKVVEVEEAGRNHDHGTYVITSTRPLVLTGGWDEIDEGKKYTIAVPGDWVWAHLRPDLVAEAPATVLGADEKIEFNDPPLPPGTQVVATIKQEMVPREAWGRGPWDEKVTHVTIADVPGRKFLVKQYEKSGQTYEDRKDLGPVKAEYVMPSYEAGKIHVAEGLPGLLDGQYDVEFVGTKFKGRIGWHVSVIRKAMVSSEATMDLQVYLGKNDSRDPAHVWVIAADGNVIGENQGAGTANFIGIPVSVVVLRYQRSNYGYTDTEEWEVYYLPASGMAEAQLAKATEIAGALEHRYFRGQGAGWEFGKVGVVRYQTPYCRDIREGTGQYDTLQKFYAAYPVDVEKYVRRNYKVAKDTYTDPEHPVVRSIVVGPELL